MIHALNVLMGLLAGVLCALGGALKDSPYEGFQPLKFLRSIGVGFATGLLSCPFTTNPLLAFCFAGYCERVAVEGYKILRAQKPGKFSLDHPAKLGATLGFTKSPASTGERIPLTAPARAYLKVSDVAVMLGVSRTKVYQLIKSGVIPHVSFGGVVRVPSELLHQLINQNRIA